jgi:hypothetical protein
MKGNGHEAFRGMIFIPLFDNNWELIGAYGKRIAKFPVSERGKTHWYLLLDFEGIYQSEAAECGLACMAMVANHHGRARQVLTQIC